MRILDHHEGHVPGPGLYRMPAALYHADPCPEPSLSSGVARLLIHGTERHAWLAHPRLGGSPEDARSRNLDLGSVAHEMLTGEGRGFEVVRTEKGPAENLLTKAAKEARDAILAEGKVPILAKDMAAGARMVAAIRDKHGRVPGTDRAFREGHGEIAVIWRDRTGIWGRALLDWLDLDTATIDDLKTTGGGLSDRALLNRIVDGLDIQDSWYRRGLAHLFPALAGRIQFRFHFVETDEPHETRIVRLTGEQQDLGERKVIAAAVAFRECLRAEEWPGYADEISRVPSPDWVEAKWLDFELSSPLFRRHGAQISLAHSPFAPAKDAA